MTDYRMRRDEGIVLRRGALTPVPGLAVTAGDADDIWHVTHIRSGASVCILPSPEGALAFAATVGPLADWTAPAADLRGDPVLTAAVRSAILDAGGNWSRWRPAEIGDLP